MSGYQNYNENNYNGSNGGGFQANGDGSNDGSSQSRTQNKSHITPVTIKQILESEQTVPDGPYVINNVELNLVSFVGIVRSVADNTSNLVILVEDGTGKFEFRKWVEDTLGRDGDDEMGEDNGDSHSNLDIGKYVYVRGSLKDFNTKKNLQYPTVVPITDYNVVLYHYLEAIKVHAEAQGVKSSKEGESLFVSGPAHEELDTAGKILKLIKDSTPTMPDGVSLAYIQQTFKLDTSEAIKHLEALEESAKIYHGIDDNSFMAV